MKACALMSMAPRRDSRSEAAPPPHMAGDVNARGRQSLCLLALLRHVQVDAEQLRHQLGKPVTQAVTPDGLLLAASYLGLDAELAKTPRDRLSQMLLPEFAKLAQFDIQRVLLQEFTESERSRHNIEPIEAFTQAWTGDMILSTTRVPVSCDLARPVFSWIVTAIVNCRRMLGGVFVISLFLQLSALVLTLIQRQAHKPDRGRMPNRHVA